MFALKIVSVQNFEASQVKENPKLAPIMKDFLKLFTAGKEIATVWKNNSLLLFFIPDKIKTPDMVKIFQTF